MVAGADTGREASPRSAGRTEALARFTIAAVRRQLSDRLLGWTWWLLDPLIHIGIYALVFGEWLGIRGEGSEVDYPLFLACSVLPWRWFTQATSNGASAFRQNASLIASAPVSRDAILLSELGAASLQALVTIPLLFFFMISYERPMTPSLVWLPLPLLAMGLLSAGIAYLLCPLTVMLADVSNALSVTLRAAWFLSPALYSLDQVPVEFRWTYAAINPLVGILEGIRRPIFDGLPPLWWPLLWSALWAFGLLWIGRWTFRRLQSDAVRLL